MAQQITKWKAADGSEWSSQEKADERELLILAVQIAMKPLGDRPNLPNCGFDNGGGYVQHDPASVVRARLDLYEIAKGPLGWWIKEQKEKHGQTDYSLAVEVHVSWHQRMLDGGCDPLERAYGRICCIDDKYREWGQPFFGMNPDKGKQVQLR